jgi:hypothetical protein
MRLLLCLFALLAGGCCGITLAETAPQELLTAKTVYLRDRGGDRKLSDQIRQEVKQWGRWELVSSAKDADLVLVLTVETKQWRRFSLRAWRNPTRRNQPKSMRFAL